MRRDEYEMFVEAELPRLLGYARVLTGNDHDAWDLVQDGLVRVGLRWGRVERAGNPAAYTRTTLVRLNIDRLRRGRRERVVGELPGNARWLVKGADHGPETVERVAAQVAATLVGFLGGKQVATMVGKRIPLFGGVVGAASDARATRRLGRDAARDLPRV